ncbi:MAG: helix-turn-helix domain-containing protein [Pirellulaceae bacterium]
MIVSTKERCSVLRLLNVSEAARHLEIPIQHLHYWIRAGRVARPQVQIGKRWYYHAEDLPTLAKQFANTEKHP